MSNACPRVLYLVYWGAAEPLGQSIVLPAITTLAAMGTAITLITFEKPADLALASEMKRISASLTRHGVRWTPLRYHKRPKGPAKVLDVLHGIAVGLRESLRRRPHIIHARTLVGGVMGVVLAPLVSGKLVYHAEGFYPDEQVDSGVWTEGSFMYRLGTSAERFLFSHADGIVVLSEGGRSHIERRQVGRGRATPVIVVPSSVDLALFSKLDRSPWRPESVLRLVYAGSIGGRYRLERVAEFAATALRRLGRVTLRVLTHTSREIVTEILRASGLPREAWSLDSVEHGRVPEELSQQNVGLHFLTAGIGQYAGSPTKVGEYWASGLPVVITRGVGDTEEIIRRERVGVVVREFYGEAYDHAFSELLNLLKDPYLASRCRAAAEKHYGLELACERLRAMYLGLAGRHPGDHDDEARDAGPQWPEAHGEERDTRRTI